MRNPSPCHLISFPLSFFSVVPLCRCWRPEGTRHPRDWAVCRCSYPAHKHYQTYIQPGSAPPYITHKLPIWPNQPSMFLYARCAPMKRHNRTGYVNISRLMAEDGNDPLPVQRTMCKGQTLSRCYVLCSKPLAMLLLFDDLS